MPAQKGITMINTIVTAFLALISPIRISEKDIATQITAELIQRKHIMFDGFTPYIQLKTHWQVIERKQLSYIIRAMICSNDRAKVRSSHISEVIKRITDESYLQINITEAFWKQQHLINFKNGVFDILKQTLEDDRSKYIFDYVVDAEYLEECCLELAPAFYKFIETSAGLENLECIMRSMGYILSSRTDAKKAFFIIGPPDGGKSTLLRLISKSVPKELISSVSFSQIADPHYVVQTVGKRINISSDNSSKAMDNEETFKSIVSNEEITGRELYEAPIRFTPTLKLIYASNYPYNFKHPDEALYKRMVLIPFEYSVPPEKQDRQLLEKLMDERNVIFSIAVKSLKDLITSGYNFKVSDKGQAYINSRISALHSTEDFLSERCVLDPNGSASSAILLANYEEWCKDNVIHPMPKSEFLEHTMAYSDKITHSKIGPKEKRVWGFKGLRLRQIDEFRSE